MAGLDELLGIIPIDQVAARLGVDERTAKEAVTAALPALVGGLEANAKDPDGARSLSKALKTKNPGLVAGGVSLDDVDDTDGAKIVRNIFGSNEEPVVAKLGETTKSGSGLLQKLLPILAPIVMAFVANKMSGGSKAGTSSGSTSSPAGDDDDSGGGLGDLLGSILGGGAAGSGSGGGGLLGGLLGGGGIGDLLGGLLGGGKR